MRVVTSSRAGMGKSLYIQRMKEELIAKKSSNEICDVVIPVHGPKVTSDGIVQSLKQPFEHHTSNQAILFHLDVAPNVCVCVCVFMLSDVVHISPLGFKSS